jgi:hypothetical protein
MGSLREYAVLALNPVSAKFRRMVMIAELEKLAFALPDADRAVLASHLLRSLPSVLHDEDEGVAEALRRDVELDAHPEAGITLEDLDRRIRERRR